MENSIPSWRGPGHRPCTTSSHLSGFSSSSRRCSGKERPSLCSSDLLCLSHTSPSSQPQHFERWSNTRSSSHSEKKHINLRLEEITFLCTAAVNTLQPMPEQHKFHDFQQQSPTWFLGHSGQHGQLDRAFSARTRPKGCLPIQISL